MKNRKNIIAQWVNLEDLKHLQRSQAHQKNWRSRTPQAVSSSFLLLPDFSPRPRRISFAGLFGRLSSVSGSFYIMWLVNRKASFHCVNAYFCSVWIRRVKRASTSIGHGRGTGMKPDLPTLLFEAVRCNVSALALAPGPCFLIPSNEDHQLLLPTRPAAIRGGSTQEHGRGAAAAKTGRTALIIKPSQWGT